MRMAPALLTCATVAACSSSSTKHETVLTFSGSALGAEGTLVAKQLKRFAQLNPGIRVELQRTPDDASQRHQLYVQWLNARVGNPSILQLDVVWTPEFAAAGWVLPLEKYGPPRLRARHLPFEIDERARQVWLGCFERVLEGADVKYQFPMQHMEGFKDFLKNFSAWMVNKA